MKMTVKIVALALVLVMALACLISCGKTIKGEYEASVLGTGVNLKFDGKNVAITVKVLGLSSDPINATYKIEDDKITFTLPENAELTDKEKETLKDLEKASELVLGEEDGKPYIKIGGVKYTSVEK